MKSTFLFFAKKVNFQKITNFLEKMYCNMLQDKNLPNLNYSQNSFRKEDIIEKEVS